jgi:hypothetical protein
MNQTENNSNTLNEEISNYDTEEINQYIIAVREELKHLDSKNEELEKKNNEENIRYVESFIRIYEETIIQQAKDMETLSEQIKELLLTKEYLHGKQDEYNKLLNSERFNDLIYKIRRIKEIKTEMYHFLKKRGIRPPFN